MIECHKSKEKVVRCNRYLLLNTVERERDISSIIETGTRGYLHCLPPLRGAGWVVVVAAPVRVRELVAGGAARSLVVDRKGADREES